MGVLPLFLLLLLAAADVRAGVALLVGEPFGRFGWFNPTGHAAVYLSRVCAESPVELRRCRPGEYGAVLSRYHRVAGYDWLAVPLVPYLYAVNRPEEVPETAGPAFAAELRDRYRRAHLEEFIPTPESGEAPRGDWIQLVGSAYDRTLYGYLLETREEDDDRLIEYLNSRPNRARFNIFYRNCADFARGIVNFYYPGALRRSILADAGITTPKHAAKSLVRHGRRNPDLSLSGFRIPQIPGARPSTRVRGVSESLVRSKKYVVPLAIFQPWVAVTAATAYLATGRFNATRLAENLCAPESLPACVSGTDRAAGTAGEEGARRARLDAPSTETGQ